MNNVTALKTLKIDCVFVFFLNSSWSVRIQVQPQYKNEKILADKHRQEGSNKTSNKQPCPTHSKSVK